VIWGCSNDWLKNTTARSPNNPRDRTYGDLLGADDLPDGVERGAILKGKRYDISEGQRITVSGKLFVIDHEACFVGKVFVSAWTEIRTEEGK
jgi:hypothetical protein